MSGESVWNVVKWVLAALAAGFIGHFGRILAERLINHRSQRAAPPPGSPPTAKIEKKRIKQQAKLAKKKLKAEVKQTKQGREE